ncbi:hypothetical protein, partial [Ferrimicrobium sp.]|uniref:hypothetical protein n=1 Tax=Ferrimicrobium sp. TaxID=2926050 RepID=UPI002604CC3D
HEQEVVTPDERQGASPGAEGRYQQQEMADPDLLPRLGDRLIGGDRHQGARKLRAFRHLRDVSGIASSQPGERRWAPSVVILDDSLNQAGKEDRQDDNGEKIKYHLCRLGLTPEDLPRL